MKILLSAKLTILLFISMAAYLVQGKFFEGSLSPQIMVSLAIVLILQSFAALFYRAVYLFHGLPLQPKRHKKMQLGMSVEEAYLLLGRMGFSESKIRGDQIICYTKRGALQNIFEMLIYVSMIFMLISGLLNYSLGISGQIDVSPGSEFIDLSKVPLNRGFLASSNEPAFKIRMVSIDRSAEAEFSKGIFEVIEKDNKFSYSINKGESFNIGRYRFFYLGDFYIAFISIMKKQHDYMPSPLLLKKEKASDNIYKGDIFIAEPGASGKGEFDPQKNIFRIKAYKDGKQEFDTLFHYGETAEKGDYTVRVPALSHSGKVEISRYGYRSYVIAGSITFGVFLALRLFFRRKMVWIWTENGTPFFFTKHRALRPLLL